MFNMSTMSHGKLTLVSHPLCPFVQRAVILFFEQGTRFERLDVDLAAKPEWFLALSPTGKVPLLKVMADNGTEVVLFESVVICEYLNEAQGTSNFYSADALLRAQQRAWVVFGTSVLGDAWDFLNCSDSKLLDAKQNAFHEKLLRVEGQLNQGPYFSGPTFGMVDVVFAPIFRYFDVIATTTSHAIFRDLPRVSAWRAALASRPSVISAVREDYAELFHQHLRRHDAAILRIS